MFGSVKIHDHRFTVLSLILSLSFLKPINNVVKCLYMLYYTAIYIKEHVGSIPLLKQVIRKNVCPTSIKQYPNFPPGQYLCA